MLKNFQEPDTSKLNVGMKVKNYKALCELLGAEVKDGHSKISQLKDWHRYIEIEKEPNKNSYIITKIYDKPRKYFENKGRSSIYHNDAKMHILSLLKQNNGEFSCERKIWWLELGLVNKNFVNFDSCKEEVENKSETDIYNKIYLKAYSIFQYVIEQLEKDGLVTIETQIILDNQFYAEYTKLIQINITPEGMEYVSNGIENNRMKINSNIIKYFTNKLPNEEQMYIEKYIMLTE